MALDGAASGIRMAAAPLARL